MKSPIIISQKKFDHSLVIYRSDEIVEIICSDNYEYSVADIKENLEYIKSVCGNKKISVLNNLQKFTTVNNEVREFVAKAPHKDFIKAEAFVIHSTGQWLLANFYLKVNKPIVPAKFFKTRNDAEKWIKGLQ